MRQCRGGAAVLVVDDDAAFRDAAAMLLGTEGYTALGAKNGPDAFEVLRAGDVRPRLIILDLAMPLMDGFAFRKAQLSDPALASIPVVVLSGGSGVRDAGEALGALASIEKPVDGDQLLRLVVASTAGNDVPAGRRSRRPTAR
jgi:CheY-like chemotaxis protein